MANLSCSSSSFSVIGAMKTSAVGVEMSSECSCSRRQPPSCQAQKRTITMLGRHSVLATAKCFARRATNSATACRQFKTRNIRQAKKRFSAAAITSSMQASHRRLLGFRGRNLAQAFSSSSSIDEDGELVQPALKSFGGAQVVPTQSIRGLVKFYKSATHFYDESKQKWVIHLDDKPVRTPRKNVIKVDGEDLAFAIAQEWDKQVDRIEPGIMPLTAIVCAYIDQYPGCTEDVIVELKRYITTDTICFRADEDEERELHLQQRELWDPIIDWMSREYDIRLGTTQTIIKPQHSENYLERLDEVLRSLNDAELCALYSITTVCKSLSIGMAVIKRFITIDEAVAAARTEEEYQIKLWGMVEGGHDVDRAHIRVQVSSASTFLWLVNGE